MSPLCCIQLKAWPGRLPGPFFDFPRRARLIRIRAMTAASEKPEWAQSKREKDNARRIAEGQKPRRRLMPWIVLALIIAAVVGFVLPRPPAPEAEIASTEPVTQQLL